MKKNRNAYMQVTNDGIDTMYDMSVDITGPTRLDKLILVDQKDGKEWELIINDGSVYIEPYDRVEKRDFKIKKVIE